MKQYIALTLAVIALASVVVPTGAALSQVPPVPALSSRPLVDADAFKDKRAYDQKKGIVIQPMIARMIVPGMDKDAVYRIVGTPHFGETITRTFNYILNLTATGHEPMRCRMQVVFGTPRQGPLTSRRPIVVRVVWQTSACADRVAAA
ncbi:outer membrane protein assembly factor BamE domain-containing protein [Sphingomonas aerolata]|uniref:outer membrane protein assembly factor BamE domain-containing protein n=1 Tax=Sphingomonas aerolata TaxID=185951 RepID=UPI00208FDDA2|nr:outer membrane protein assembly factor BamE [Sphingomonas aerolata]USR02313.1 outer membrane protein assembly factor BamE [Sphingomonas aerolata]